MAGLMNTPTAALQAAPAQAVPVPDQSAQGAIPSSSDPILKQIQDGIDAKVSPNLKRDYLAVVVAGMKVITDPKSSQRIVQKLRTTQNLPQDVAQGTANIMALVANSSNGNINVPAAMPASIVIMCQILDLAEKTAGLKLTPDIAAQCTKATADAVLEKFGADDQKVNAVVQSAQAQQNKGA